MIRTHTMRPAFSMMMALLVIIIMATIGAFILNLSGKMIQETTTQYRQEQAALYAKSYTEFAIMAATAQTCIKKISANVDGNTNEVLEGDGYRVVVYVKYIGGCDPATSTIQYPASKANVITIDTYVHYRNPEDPRSTASNPWSAYPGVTFHRRTIQKL